MHMQGLAQHAEQLASAEQRAMAALTAHDDLLSKFRSLCSEVRCSHAHVQYAVVLCIAQFGVDAMYGVASRGVAVCCREAAAQPGLYLRG